MLITYFNHQLYKNYIVYIIQYINIVSKSLNLKKDIRLIKKGKTNKKKSSFKSFFGCQDFIFIDRKAYLFIYLLYKLV